MTELFGPLVSGGCVVVADLEGVAGGGVRAGEGDAESSAVCWDGWQGGAAEGDLVVGGEALSGGMLRAGAGSGIRW